MKRKLNSVYSAYLNAIANANTNAIANNIPNINTNTIANAIETISVATYNILSSSLSDKKSFPGYKDENINPQNRYLLLLNKLNRYIKKYAIICLQEVSQEWSGPLHTHFYSHEYTMIYSQYGGEFDNFMGVAIAFPNSYFLKKVIICKPAKLIGAINKNLITYKNETYQSNFLLKNIESIVKKKSNSLIMVCLKYGSDSVFWIATYHMPCEFRNPDLLMYHALILLKSVQDEVNDEPYILCGDFNFTPDSEPYKYICKKQQSSKKTTSEIATDLTLSTAPTLPASPLIWNDVCAKFNLMPIKSAYLTFHGEEPTYTNYVNGWNGIFMGTLDYVFYSGMKVTYVEKIRTNQQFLPNENESSDHLPIYAEFNLL